ncbi:MAG TPA: DnaB-like helicase N-terminal domain-containing protein [Rugosimonospora sp.]|nr:DnaB-like helicase N-terminal domain-containing protein [Rugosimonospora sp.]
MGAVAPVAEQVGGLMAEGRMSGLILRAEQGVLGGLLRGVDPALITTTLTSDDFAHPTHQAIYKAVCDVEHLDYTSPRLHAAVAAIVDEPGVTAAWLRELAEAAPSALHVRAYTQIVVQAAFDRDTAQYAAPYLAAAARAADPTAQTRLTRLGHALADQAAVYARISDVDPHVAALTNGPAPTPRVGGMHPEEQIIADLLQHPEQARAVAPWLDSALFSNDQHRRVFEMAVSLAYDNDAVDAVIVGWQVTRAHPAGPHPDEATSDYRFLTNLESRHVPTGTAVRVGTQLLAEHVQASVAVTTATVAASLRPVVTTTSDRHAEPTDATPTTVEPHGIEL